MSPNVAEDVMKCLACRMSLSRLNIIDVLSRSVRRFTIFSRFSY